VHLGANVGVIVVADEGDRAALDSSESGFASEPLELAADPGVAPAPHRAGPA